MTGKRFDDRLVWVPKLDDLDHCANCGQPWDQHRAGSRQSCPRVIDAEIEQGKGIPRFHVERK